MTKTMIAIGFLVAITMAPMAQAQATRPQYIIILFATTGGSQSEAATFRVTLPRLADSDCVMDGKLMTKFPETGRVIQTPFHLSNESPYAEQTVEFQPSASQLRETAVAEVAIDKRTVSGGGSCHRLFASSEIFDAQTGETHAGGGSLLILVTPHLGPSEAADATVQMLPLAQISQ